MLFNFLRTRPEYIAASVAPGGELCVVAGAAVDAVGLGAELLVYEGGATFGADEAGLVPVLFFVGKVLEISVGKKRS